MNYLSLAFCFVNPFAYKVTKLHAIKHGTDFKWLTQDYVHLLAAL